MGRHFTEFITADEHGHLGIEQREASALANEFGTPLYVISEGQIRHNVRAITRAFRGRYPRTEILFSNKANNNPAIRRVFNQEGAGGDCFGYGELYLSLLAGTDPDKLMLNGSNKAEPELAMAVEAGVTINLDVFEELQAVAAIARRLGTRARVNVRTRLGLHEMDAAATGHRAGVRRPGRRHHGAGDPTRRDRPLPYPTPPAAGRGRAFGTEAAADRRSRLRPKAQR